MQHQNHTQQHKTSYTHTCMKRVSCKIVYTNTQQYIQHNTTPHYTATHSTNPHSNKQHHTRKDDRSDHVGNQRMDCEHQATVRRCQQQPHIPFPGHRGGLPGHALHFSRRHHRRRQGQDRASQIGKPLFRRVLVHVWVVAFGRRLHVFCGHELNFVIIIFAYVVPAYTRLHRYLKFIF